MARSARISLFTRLLLRGPFLIALLLGVSYPSQGDASFTSFASSFFTNTTQAADTSAGSLPARVPNSQNVALLLATVNTVDPASSIGGSTDINIVNGSALVADSGPLGTIADIEEQSPDSDTISIYTVREGDTLQKVARMFGVSVNTILWGNDIQASKDLRIGQDLIILPVSGVKYTIKQGDTIQALAKRYGGNVDEILRFNNLEKGRKLAIGQEIIIPNGEIRSLSPAVRGQATSKVIKTYIDEAVDSLSYYIRPVINGRRSQGLHGKNGIDIAPNCHCSGREPLLAAAAGQVIIARTGGWNGGYGNYIVISHPNGTQTLYGHIHSISVRPGDNVAQGQLVGTVGSSGKSTGPHVHFEIRGARNPF